MRWVLRRGISMGKGSRVDAGTVGLAGLEVLEKRGSYGALGLNSKVWGASDSSLWIWKRWNGTLLMSWFPS